ncbi:hypothetical protein C2G38_2036210 [Gigaspora rosea]|uniref:Uncharacterized protein n=1 Tax=Gigaspora rosea TaxID=44941 RepID=A0A397V9P4_9GLOM|nr:hypothetical protein C2G38_2036210 [Gigaspora rosea]
MRGQRFGIMIKNFVDQNSKTLFNSKDNILLKQVLFSVNNVQYIINYGILDKYTEDLRVKSIIYAINHYKITREALRSLTGIEHHLPREWLISEMQAKITAEISQAIKVYTFDLEELIDDDVFYEKENCKIEKGIYRSIKDILNYTIPAWLENRLSGDGRNVGRKIKHVMVTFTLLNNSLNYYEPDYHYTLILYPGIESYESLKLATKLLIKDLNDIKTGFIDYQERKWNVELYFSANWKFMPMCLGHKAANCDAFCLWCNCKKIQLAI